MKTWDDMTLQDYCDDLARSLYEIGQDHLWDADAMNLRILLEANLRMANNELNERTS
tara:strand:+ start:943 stop:1113 length:171 start_codon:yes stop_codon:yes gene_type:complete